MATKINRGTSWEFVVKRKGLLEKPIYLRFKDEAEGDEYVRRIEKMLDSGIVPQELVRKSGNVTSLKSAITSYMDAVHLTQDDISILNALIRDIGATRVDEITFRWAEDWVAELKHDLAPSTVRHKVGALARCLDWIAHRKDTMLVVNPLRQLPKRYSTKQNDKEDNARDRRLLDGEEQRIRKILSAEDDLFFTFALETAMRMREIYTLTPDQIDVKRRTIFLTKTKNGDNRQVPMSSVLLKAVPALSGDRVFSFWNGSSDPAELRKTSWNLSHRWQKIFRRAGCVDLRFHDLRHEATSRLFERTTLNVIEISRITGHRSLQMLRRYSNLRGTDLADKLW